MRPLASVEVRFWTGPVGHLLGGALDVAEVWLLYLRKNRSGRRAGRPEG